MTELYAVIGKPVLHSRSPQMHNAAFAELKIDARYFRIAAESAEEGLRMAGEMGVLGMNVTSPFKGIARLMDDVDPLAKRVGAINTVRLKDGRKAGHNTDVYGAAHAFLSNGIALEGKKALVLGAGGAARAAIVAMLENGADVVVSNRTAGKAESLANGFGAGSCALDGLNDAIADCELVVGCLSTGERVLPEGLLRKDMAVMDAHYASESALVRDAREAGCRVLDGREWLLYQGVKAFEIFTGKDAPVDAMRQAAYAADAPKKSNIALIGFMGSGKDTIAAELHEKTGMAILDIDKEIERKAGMAIKDIFKSEGEEGFRKMERGALASVAGCERCVINCGGGAVLDAGNRRMLRDKAAVVWLWADAKTVIERVPKDGERPLLDVAEPEKAVGRLLSDRLGYYAEACDMVVDTVGKRPSQIAERILYED
ncbi:MAG: shikimate kinase [Candidatus Micrarchaeota archaeon]